MKPETRKYLAKARSDLADARKIAGIGLAKVAARSAYFAVFHAAEGFIFERSGKAAKTHSGVRSEFARLARAAPGIDRSFSTFLAEAYKYKDISDYRVDESDDVTMDEANAAIASAERHLSGIASFLEKSNGSPKA